MTEQPFSQKKPQETRSDQSIPTSTLRGLITLVLVLGLVGGGMAGALVSSYLQQKSDAPKGADQDLTPKIAKVVTVEDSTLSDMIDKASQSVVSIIAEKNASQASGPSVNPFDFGFDIPGFNIIPQAPSQPQPRADHPDSTNDKFVRVSAGTGFVVSEKGLILTNRHVVDDTTARYSILTKDGKKYEVEVLGVDPVNDLAVVKTKDEVRLPALELGSSDTARIGQTVLAIGNSLGEFSNTVTKGVISGINRRVTASDGAGSAETLESVIQTDAAINPGNSGGPLLNIAGQVLGVNTAVSQQGQSIGFAIPINDAISFVDSIEKYGRVVRPYLGVRYVIIDQELKEANNLSVDYGALLRRGDQPGDLAVIPGSPADIAGLEENDIILEIDGQKVDDQHSLVRLLGKYQPSDTVKLKILKDGKEVEKQVKLGEFGKDNSK